MNIRYLPLAGLLVIWAPEGAAADLPPSRAAMLMFVPPVPFREALYSLCCCFSQILMLVLAGIAVEAEAS